MKQPRKVKVDVRDATSEFDSHLHLGTGRLDIARIVREALPPAARVSIETAKDSPDSLDDFRRDVEWLRRRERDAADGGWIWYNIRHEKSLVRR